MRLIYTLTLYLLTPVVIARLVWRGLRARAYWRRWPERFGLVSPVGHDSLWVHAVSVGEVQAAAPLIERLLQAGPGLPLIVTTMTPTGSAHVRKLFGDKVVHCYVPYDLPGSVIRFLDRARPRLALIMETELWPNLFFYCHQRAIPVVVANARLSERSARGYRRFAALTRQTLQQVSDIAAQASADADRLVGLGADALRVVVTGSIKFDIAVPKDKLAEANILRTDLGKDRPVWIAASTHEGEDEQVLEAHIMVSQRIPDALLILVPRHPERFERVAALSRKRGFQILSRSERRFCDAETGIFIGDTMGEMPVYYGAADVAFVGGSLVPTGGHNPLEPAALAVPVIVGPHVFNFADINRMLLEADAERSVSNAVELADTVIQLLDDDELRARIGRNGQQVIEQNRGALDKLLAVIGRHLDFPLIPTGN